MAQPEAKFEVGDEVECTKIGPLEGNTEAPKLEMEGKYKVNAICLDEKSNQHLDVGLVSKLAYVRSHETGEHLPNGDKIHWCHPSRFKKIA